MITRIESLSGLPVPEDPFTLRIVSAAEAYGLSTAFLDVWQGNGCLFSRMDGVLTIAGKPDPNETEETALFAASCGAGQIFCAPDTARVLGCRNRGGAVPRPAGRGGPGVGGTALSPGVV